MRLNDLKNIFHEELDGLYGQEEVNNFFFILIEEFYKIHRIELALQPETSITKKEQEPIFKALDELKKEKPIQYILGKTEFFGLPFKVNSEVLIPRPETEELVALILDTVTSSAVKKSLKILDIGTGSGCIAISLAKNLPISKVYAIDVSTEALKVARENARLNNVEVVFIEVDILSISNTALDESKFDVIVSNPPYVRQQEKQEIKNNVLKNEPHLALFVRDDDSLQFYKAIVQFGLKNLTKKGLLFFEINEYLGAEMVKLLRESNFNIVELRKDMFGKDRMIKATGYI
ncbi:MAG: peptide chain release factor N(5)-glutamine methyltransferase [Flavobacteriaceae bacterium]|nr:peptide chain release factor N(5)-glutamine methyltransferase [Flavobacteriaceae bacterium]